MDRIRSWFQRTNSNSTLASSRLISLELFLLQRQTNEFYAHLQRKDDRLVCIDAFFHTLPKLSDEDYINELFAAIIKKSNLPLTQLSNITSSRLKRTIANGEYDLCEKILQFSSKTIPLVLVAPDVAQLTHTCVDRDQTIRCLSLLIESNRRSDPEYLKWIFMTLVEYYQPGDDIILEHFLNLENDSSFLYVPCGRSLVTPMMLFLHLYADPKCQALIDHQLSKVTDARIWLQRDQWNRSYLSHLLCSGCQHDSCGSTEPVLATTTSEIQEQLLEQCPRASAVLHRFSHWCKLETDGEMLVKAISTSQYCVPLRILLLFHVRESQPSVNLKFNDFFTNFPANYIPLYATYLHELVRHQNLDEALVSVIRSSRRYDRTVEQTVKFLLRQGARVPDMGVLKSAIIEQLREQQSMVPFMLLEYSMYIDITDVLDASLSVLNMKLYVCRFLHCGYHHGSQERFHKLKPILTPAELPVVEALIDVRNPQSLAYSCRQKLRRSWQHLGDETIEKLKDRLSDRLIQSVRHYGYRDWVRCYQALKNLQ